MTSSQKTLVGLLGQHGWIGIVAAVLLESAGVPAVGRMVVLAAGYLASRGVMSLPVVAAATAAAAIAGGGARFAIGSREGRRFVEEARPALGTLAACALGYLFGLAWERLEGWIGRPGLFALGLAGVVVLFGMVQQRRALAAGLRRGIPAVLAAASLCAVGVFAKIADEVQERETSAVDRAVSLAVHRLDSPAMDAVMQFLSLLGSFPAIAAVVIGAAIWRLRRGDRPGAFMLVGVSLITELLNLALKEAFQRTRPSLFQEIATLNSYSFPSGHAMASAAVYGALSALVARSHPRLARRAFALAGGLVFLIGLSRVYLGVHWITDVVAGWAAGLAVALIGTLLLQAQPDPPAQAASSLSSSGLNTTRRRR